MTHYLCAQAEAYTDMAAEGHEAGSLGRAGHVCAGLANLAGVGYTAEVGFPEECRGPGSPSGDGICFLSCR